MWPFYPPPLTTLTCPPDAHPIKPNPFKTLNATSNPSFLPSHTLYLGSDQSTCSTKLPNAGVAYEIFSLNRNG